MNWIINHSTQIALTISAIVLIVVGRGPLLPYARKQPWLMWVAFAISIIAGLVLGYALFGIMGWLTGLPAKMGAGFSGAAVGFVTNTIAVVVAAVGWASINMITALVRDVADGRPDEDARRAALWVPTMAPAGLGAAWGVASNPGGIGSDVTALLIAAVTVLYCVKICKTMLAAHKAPKMWKWLAAVVSALAGVVLIPLVAYADTRLAGVLDPQMLLGVRIIVGVVGVALAVAMLVDIADRVPDKYARVFLTAGVPMLAVCGMVAVSAIASGGASGGEILFGGMK